MRLLVLIPSAVIALEGCLTLKKNAKTTIMYINIHKPCPSMTLRSVNCALSPWPLRWIQMPTKRFFFPGACLSDDSTAMIVPVKQNVN